MKDILLPTGLISISFDDRDYWIVNRIDAETKSFIDVVYIGRTLHQAILEASDHKEGIYFDESALNQIEIMGI